MTKYYIGIVCKRLQNNNNYIGTVYITTIRFKIDLI